MKFMSILKSPRPAKLTLLGRVVAAAMTVCAAIAAIASFIAPSVLKAVSVACVAVAAALAFSLFTGSACAQTDITTAVSTVSGYWDAVKVISIAILLFVIGRRVVRKL